MRAKEFIAEVKLQDNLGKNALVINNSLPGAFVHRDLRNTDPYMQYRYGLALAGARANVGFEQESEWAENLSLVTFSKEDEETIRLADKLMGVKASRIASSQSIETDVYAVSPVAKPKRNKYGV